MSDIHEEAMYLLEKLEVQYGQDAFSLGDASRDHARSFGVRSIKNHLNYLEDEGEVRRLLGSARLYEICHTVEEKEQDLCSLLEL